MTAGRRECKKAAAAPEDRSYFLQRAEDELERAQSSSDPSVVRAHYTMAERYLDRVYATPPADKDE
jgi:hypothetical protein